MGFGRLIARVAIPRRVANNRADGKILWGLECEGAWALCPRCGYEEQVAYGTSGWLFAAWWSEGFKDSPVD